MPGPGRPTSFTVVMLEWHILLPECNSFPMCDDFSDVQALDGLGGFSGVLKVNTEI